MEPDSSLIKDAQDNSLVKAAVMACLAYVPKCKTQKVYYIAEICFKFHGNGSRPLTLFIFTERVCDDLVLLISTSTALEHLFWRILYSRRLILFYSSHLEGRQRGPLLFQRVLCPLRALIYYLKTNNVPFRSTPKPTFLLLNNRRLFTGSLC